MADRHQMIGAPVSLYSGKLRSYLRRKSIPFDEVLSTREVYRDVILPRTGVRYIPVFITSDDRALQDTTEIIDFLEQRHPAAEVYPPTPAQRLVALLLEVYGDEWLVIPAMHYRWSIEENRAFALREFGLTSQPDWSEADRAALAEQISKPFASALPGLGISPTTIPAIEESYLQLLSELDQHLAHHPFVLGSRPSIGDFGLFGPLYAHLYRDPYSGRLMQAHAPHVAAWVERMHAPAAPGPSEGDFMADDEVPHTLLPILARMFREQVPCLLDTVKRVQAWAQTHEEVRLPRTLGTHAFSIHGSEGERNVYPYAQWMWQRPHTLYGRLNPEERRRLQPWLNLIPGAEQALSAPIPQQVVRRANRLELAD